MVENLRITSPLLEKLLTSIKRLKWSFSLLLLVLVACSGYLSLSNLKIDNGLSLWFLEDNPSYQNYINYQETSGSDEIIIALIPTNKPLDSSLVGRLEELSQFLEQKPYIQNTWSLSNASYPLLWGDSLQFKPLYSSKRAKRSQEKLLEQLPTLKKLLLGQDQKQLLLYIQLQPITSIEAQRKQIIREIRLAVSSRFETASLSGPPILNEAYNEGVFKESLWFGLLSIFVISLMLWFLLPHKKYLPMVLAAIGVPIVILFGITSLLGFSLNMISMLIPTILLVYTVCDAVHIINIFHRIALKYPEMDQVGLLAKSFRKSFVPCSLTTLTTILSYLALSVSPLPAFTSMGMITVLGLLLSFVGVYFMVALGVFIFNIQIKPQIPSVKSKDPFTSVIHWVDQISSQHKNTIIVLSMLVLCGGILALPQIKIDTNSKDLMSDGQVKDALFQIEEQVGGSSRLQLNITSKTDGNPNAPSVFKSLKNFQEDLEAVPQIGSVVSLINLQRFLQKRNPLLQSKLIDLSPTEIPLGQILPSNSFFPIVSKDGKTVSLSLSFKQMNTSELEVLIERIEAMYEKHFDSTHFELGIEGFATVYTQLNRFILKSQLYSFLLAIIGSFICLLLFVKKLKTSLLILLPNLLPLAVLILAMVVLEIPLGVTTAMITPIMLGIVMDDSIHLLYHYKPQNIPPRPSQQRISQSLHYNGKALFTATLSLVAGFLIIATSAVPSVIDFGILCAITVASALVSDLFFMSALLKKYDT